MSVEYSNSSVANMDVEGSKISYKRLLMDNDKLQSTVDRLKENPFRVSTICLGVLCLLLIAGLIGQSVSSRSIQQESTNKLQSANAQLKDLEKSLSSAQKEKGKIEERQRMNEQVIERLTSRRDQLQAAYSSQAEEAYKARQSESTLKTSNAALTNELQQIKTRVTQLESENNAIATARDLAQVTLEQTSKLKTTLEGNYKTLTAERNNLQNSFNNISRVKDQLQLSYTSLMSKVEDMEKRLHLSTTEKEQAQTGHMNATMAKNALTDMYNLLVEATEQLNSSYNNLVKEKQELEKSCDSIRTERSSMIEKNGNLTAERDQLQLEIIKLNATIAAKKCPSGWQKYMYSCYYTSSTKKNWKSSRDFCKNKGADLAVITSREEMNFINRLYSSDKEVWIGLTDDGVEGHWAWVDGTPLNPNATFWGSGQPNSYDGRNQDCVEFWHRATGHGEWNDESCKIEQYWICEM